jgi:hypothetical protein
MCAIEHKVVGKANATAQSVAMVAGKTSGHATVA